MSSVASTEKLLTSTMPSNNEPSSQDKHLEKLLDEVYSTKDIEMKTELTNRQINAYAKALLFADEFNSDIIKHATYKLMTLLVSKKRQGRKEFTEIMQRSNTEERFDGGGIASRLLGGV